MRTTLTQKEIIKINDMHRQMKLSNPSIEFKEVKMMFFKERHKKDLEKYKKEYPKIRAVERKNRKQKFENPRKMAE
jgi:hypothetical protein